MAEMADTLTCPVCERPGVPLKSATCPQCDADLTCFQALETLAAKKSPAPVSAAQEISEQTAKQKNAPSTRRAVLLLLLLLALIGAFFFYFFLQAKDRMQELGQQVVALKTDLRMAQQETGPTEQILCVLPGLEKTSAAKEEDSFAEDDPLMYEEDRDTPTSSGNNSKEQGTVMSSSSQVKTAEKVESEEMSASGSLPQEDMERDAAGEAEKIAASVPIIGPALRKKKADTPVENSAAESGNDLRTSGILLPEKQWTEKTFLYLVKEMDTLWGLAERFYGDGKYYPVIMEQNPRLIISDIHDEESLRLFNDRSVLRDLYNGRIEWRDGLTLWKHEVQAGETRQAIEKRFASPGASDRVLYEQEPDISPGATVRVILH